jgi:uncharacterized protein YrrD
LRKAKDVIGLPVVTINTGKQVGTVKDMKVGSDWRLKAIVLEAKTWFASGRTIPVEHIVAMGANAVTIPSEESALQHEEELSARPLVDGAGKLFGLPVLTVAGEQLGIVEDVYFEQKVGIPVVAFELSEGFLTDLQEGRRTFSIPEHCTLGEDAIVVPSSWSDSAEPLRTPQ